MVIPTIKVSNCGDEIAAFVHTSDDSQVILSAVDDSFTVELNSAELWRAIEIADAERVAD